MTRNNTMKRAAALFLLLLFSNVAVASPFDSGGGSASSDDEADLSLILMIAVAAGIGAFLVLDVIADNSSDSQDALTHSNQEAISEDTGVNWEQLAGGVEIESLPVLAVSVFNGSNGRDLANYFSNLVTPGDELYYTVYESPVSFGQMDPAEAAETGFSFLDCQLFMAVDSDKLELYSNEVDEPLWLFSTSEWDSAMVREASASFLDYSRNL